MLDAREEGDGTHGVRRAGFSVVVLLEPGVCRAMHKRCCVQEAREEGDGMHGVRRAEEVDARGENAWGEKRRGWGGNGSLLLTPCIHPMRPHLMHSHPILFASLQVRMLGVRSAGDGVRMHGVRMHGVSAWDGVRSEEDMDAWGDSQEKGRILSCCAA